MTSKVSRILRRGERIRRWRGRSSTPSSRAQVRAELVARTSMWPRTCWSRSPGAQSRPDPRTRFRSPRLDPNFAAAERSSLRRSTATPTRSTSSASRTIDPRNPARLRYRRSCTAAAHRARSSTQRLDVLRSAPDPIIAAALGTQRWAKALGQPRDRWGRYDRTHGAGAGRTRHSQGQVADMDAEETLRDRQRRECQDVSSTHRSNEWDAAPDSCMQQLPGRALGTQRSSRAGQNARPRPSFRDGTCCGTTRSAKSDGICTAGGRSTPRSRGTRRSRGMRRFRRRATDGSTRPRTKRLLGSASRGRTPGSCAASRTTCTRSTTRSCSRVSSLRSLPGSVLLTARSFRAKSRSASIATSPAIPPGIGRNGSSTPPTCAMSPLVVTCSTSTSSSVRLCALDVQPADMASASSVHGVLHLRDLAGQRFCVQGVGDSEELLHFVRFRERC